MSFFLKTKLVFFCFFFWVCCVFLPLRLLSIAEGKGYYSSVAVPGILTMVASLVLEDIAHRLSHRSTWAYLLLGTWGPTRPEMELMSPALADGFLSTGPPVEAWNFISRMCRWGNNCVHVKAHWTVHSTKVHLITHLIMPLCVCNYSVWSNSLEPHGL